LLANGLMYLLQWLIGHEQFSALALWPLGVDGNMFSQGFLPWQLLTYGFLHGNFVHLAFNMLTLAMFGSQVEYVWGARRFLTFYLVCVAGAALCQLAVGWWTLSQGGEAYPTLGPPAASSACCWRMACCSQPARDAVVPADPDEGANPGDPLRRRRTAARPEQLAAWGRAFRPPGRDAVRLAADSLLEREAAVRSQQAQSRMRVVR
jgi:hypothetical protein